MDFVDYLNVCFFGIVGSGKTTCQNTLFAALSNREHVEHILVTGASEDHVTLKIANTMTAGMRGTEMVNIRFYDTFGLTDTNWEPETFRALLRGMLPHDFAINDHYSGSLNDAMKSAIPNNSTADAKEDNVAGNASRRIHVLLMFLKHTTPRHSQYFNKFKESVKIAVEEGNLGVYQYGMLPYVYFHDLNSFPIVSCSLNTRAHT